MTPKPQSLAVRLIAYLKVSGSWVHGGVLEEKSRAAGYKASNGSRRLRVLEEASRGLETTAEHKRAKELLAGATIVAELRHSQVWYRYTAAAPAPEAIKKPVIRYQQVQLPDGLWVMRQVSSTIVDPGLKWFDELPEPIASLRKNEAPAH